MILFITISYIIPIKPGIANNITAPIDVTEVMKSKLSGLWYNKENNLYFKIENGNYFDGEFATDAVIHCQIDNIKKISEKKYEFNTKECTFEEEKRDNIKYEFYYDANFTEITRKGINYVFISNENALYNDPVIKTITYNKYNEDTEEMQQLHEIHKSLHILFSKDSGGNISACFFVLYGSPPDHSVCFSGTEQSGY